MATAAITFVAGASLVVLAAVIVLVVLIGDIRSVASAVTAGIGELREQIGSSDQVSAVLGQFDSSITSTLSPDIAEIAGSIGNVVTVLVLGTFLTFFLLADGDKGWAWFLRQLRPWQAEAVQDSASRGLVQVAWYVRRTALLATLDGVVVGVVLTILGIPFAGALGAIAFMAGFVPYLGAVTGGVIIGLATLALGGWFPAAAVLAAMVVASIVATRMLEPTQMNSSVDVHPMLVLVALPIGVSLFGVLGLLALLPITVFARAVARSVVAALDMEPPHETDRVAEAPAAAARVDDLDPEDDSDVPLWLDRLAQLSWRGLVLIVLVGLLIGLITLIPILIVPAVIAIVGGATLRPVVDWLVGRGSRRGVATVTATVGAMALIVGSCVLAIGMTLGPLEEVVGAASSGASSINVPWLSELVSQGGGKLQVDVTALVGDVVATGFALLLAFLMTFFLLRDGPTWWGALLTRLTPGRREPVGLAGERGANLMASYMLGTAAISGFGAVTTWLILVLLGIPLAFPIGVIGFFAGFIPYIGSFISTGLATLVTFAFGTTTDVVIMLIFTVIFNIVQGNILTPLVYGKSLSLHPAVVLMAIPVGNEIAGILGMFLVVPIAAVVAATWRLVPMTIDGTGLPPDLAAELREAVPEAVTGDGPVTLEPAADVQT
jgi:predicted PurR-regulated permease PerM